MLAPSVFTVINFAQVNQDTESCITTGAAWKFTAKRAGRYDVRAAIELIAIVGAGGVSKRALICVFKNGAEWQRGTSIPVVAGNVANLLASSLVDLAAGDFLDVRVYQDASAGNESTHGTLPNVFIQRIGP